MQLRKLFDDDNAVSPVIGVILMVAITVILAAVIATFVLGLGEQVSDTAPQASFTFDYDDGASGEDSFNTSSGDGIVTITHAGGATLNADQLSVSGATPQNGKQNWADDTSGGNPEYGSNSEVSSGNQLRVRMNSDDTISVTWTNAQGTDSATLRKYDGPDA